MYSSSIQGVPYIIHLNLNGKKVFNIYSRKVNKGERHAFLYADLNIGDSGVVCEHGSTYFYFLHYSDCFHAYMCVCKPVFVFFLVYGSVLCVLLLCLSKIKVLMQIGCRKTCFTFKETLQGEEVKPNLFIKCF